MIYPDIIVRNTERGALEESLLSGQIGLKMAKFAFCIRFCSMQEESHRQNMKANRYGLL